MFLDFFSLNGPPFHVFGFFLVVRFPRPLSDVPCRSLSKSSVCSTALSEMVSPWYRWIRGGVLVNYHNSGTAGARRHPSEARASTTDPEARIMKMADGGYRPAYHLQFATDAAGRANS
jgi:hypothetical protein